MCRVIKRVCNCCVKYKQWLEVLSLTKFLRIFYISLIIGISLLSYGFVLKELWTLHFGIVFIVAGLGFAISYVSYHRCEG